MFGTSARFKKTAVSATPGPGEYDVSDNLKKNGKGIGFGVGARFKTVCDDAPGPGAYGTDSSTLVASSSKKLQTMMQKMVAFFNMRHFE